MEILVYGAGSLGSLLGGLLERSHSVTLVGREPHVSTVREEGLTIQGAIEASVNPRARTDLPSGSTTVDLGLVTVKSYDTGTAARALAAVQPDTILSVQNGLGNENTLAKWLDGTVLAGTCTYGALLDSPGIVQCSGVGEVALGARDGGHSPVAERIGDAFSEAGIETIVATDMHRRLWQKLAVNAGINATTALARVENGSLSEGPASEVATRAVRETARVARANGIDLTEDDAVTTFRSVTEATAANESSMLQDLQRGRRTEIDAINGAVTERADTSVPINGTLAALVRAWERERSLR